jgi:hypothetical protein
MCARYKNISELKANELVMALMLFKGQFWTIVSSWFSKGKRAKEGNHGPALNYRIDLAFADTC